VSECKHEWHQPHLEPVFCKKCLLDKEVWLESELAEARLNLAHRQDQVHRKNLELCKTKSELSEARREGLNSTWNEVKRYVDGRAIHRRSGNSICDQTPNQILEHLMTELIELIGAPKDIYEMADVLAIFLHFVQHQGVTQEQLAEATKKKLAMRLEIK
jgi:predicted house-cleaning noncanonical NTP pyrophosphatase (MazG superfamily)